MKIRLVSLKSYNMCIPWWYKLKPKIQRLWMGQLWHIGFHVYYIELDFRGINNLQDFADSMRYPFIWKILKKFK